MTAQRLGTWDQLKERLRSLIFGASPKPAGTDDGRPATAWRGLTACRSALPSTESPYPDLGTDDPPAAQGRQAGTVLITARFRSGSTLLWNLFRHVEGMTAYYEPLNERRWFDPTTRGTRTDPTHRNVEEYWREYDGLTELGRYFRDAWHQRDLFMDAGFWDPDLKRYIELLIERAPGRAVLQFNRVDFRLAWLRHHFPAARLIHLYRHPRDQWCSTFLSGPVFPRDGRTVDFRPFDGFYLRTWSRDLKRHFPFLDEREVEHPYQLFYYIWKLSYLFGKGFAHHSVCFEELVTQPEEQLTELFQQTNVERYDLATLKALMVKPTLGRWKDYADTAWFRRHETICETTLADFLGRTAPASGGREPPEICSRQESGGLRPPLAMLAEQR